MRTLDEAIKEEQDTVQYYQNKIDYFKHVHCYDDSEYGYNLISLWTMTQSKHQELSDWLIELRERRIEDTNY